MFSYYYYFSPIFIILSGYLFNKYKYNIIWNSVSVYTYYKDYLKKFKPSKSISYYKFEENEFKLKYNINDLNLESIMKITYMDVSYLIQYKYFNGIDNLKYIKNNILGATITIKNNDIEVLNNYDCINILQYFLKINIDLYLLAKYIIYLNNINSTFNYINLEILDKDFNIHEYKINSKKEKIYIML